MLKYQDSLVVNCQMLQKVPERKQQDHNKLGVYRRERNYWIRWSLGKIWIRRLKITKYSLDLSYGEDLQPCTSSIYEHIWSWFRVPWTRDHIGHSLTISNYDPYPLTSSSAPKKRSRFRDLVPIGTNVQIWSRKRPDLPLKSQSCLIGHNRTVYRTQTVKIPIGM